MDLQGFMPKKKLIPNSSDVNIPKFAQSKTFCTYCLMESCSEQFFPSEFDSGFSLPHIVKKIFYFQQNFDARIQKD